VTIRLHGTGGVRRRHPAARPRPRACVSTTSARPTHRTGGLVGVDPSVTLDPLDQEVNR
jgi:hypothetical protein